MDLHSFSKLDPPKKLDPDPHTVNADPKHCFAVVDSVFPEPGFFFINTVDYNNGTKCTFLKFAKMRLGNAEKCSLYHFITCFQEYFQYISGLAISGLKNLEN
jgi:hypothetical protein